MLERVESQHGHGTRSARSGLAVGSQDHGSVGYRIPREWGTLTEGQRGVGSISGFKGGSRGDSWRDTGPFAAAWLTVSCVGRRWGRIPGGGMSHSFLPGTAVLCTWVFCVFFTSFDSDGRVRPLYCALTFSDSSSLGLIYCIYLAICL